MCLSHLVELRLSLESTIVVCGYFYASTRVKKPEQMTSDYNALGCLWTLFRGLIICRSWARCVQTCYSILLRASIYRLSVNNTARPSLFFLLSSNYNFEVFYATPLKERKVMHTFMFPKHFFLLENDNDSLTDSFLRLLRSMFSFSFQSTISHVVFNSFFFLS